MKPNHTRERGATLVVALVMLVVLTLIGVQAARMALLDEKSARAGRDREIAFQAAEAALRDAWADIDSGLRVPLFDGAPSGFDAGCANVALPADAAAAATNRRGLCVPNEASDPRQMWQDVDLATRAVPFGTFTSRPWDNSQTPAPVYLVESLPFDCVGCGVQSTSSEPDQLAFRVTAVGYGPAGSNIEVALQSYYVKTR